MHWPDCLLTSGEMGLRVREFDWSVTPLGPIESWPLSLRSAVKMVLSGSFAMILYWGPEYLIIYNDAYIPIMGTLRHPDMLGQTSWVWKEMPDLRPFFEKANQTSRPFVLENVHFPLQRFGYLEEVYGTFNYSPFIYDDYDDHPVMGGYAVCVETTQKVLSERRLRMLRDLAEQTASTRETGEVCRIATQALVGNNADIPFALIYLLDNAGKSVYLAGATGIKPGQPASPMTIALNPHAEQTQSWPLNEVLQSDAVHLEVLEKRFGPISGGPWPEPAREAFLLPLLSSARREPIGVMVMGISPRLKFEDKYREFFTLVAFQIETAIANAHAYEQERQRAEALTELDRAKTMFFSNVSHEFRTPLTLILGSVEEALQESLGEQPEAYERMEVVHRNTLRMLKLVNSLLDFSRIEAGRIEALYRPVDLAILTAELASNFSSAMEKAGLNFVVNCPPLPEPLYVDVEMWEKIVLNLISNAFKNTFAGEIAVNLTWHGDHAELSIRDTGIGIAEDQFGHLFERFYRVPDAQSGSQARTQEGTGIGLALVKELVHLHGGRIHVESKVGIGSTFTVSIPAGSAHLPTERVSSRTEITQSSATAQPFIQEALSCLPQELEEEIIIPTGTVNTPPLMIGMNTSAKRFTVLLVDDNRDMRAYVQRLLKPHYDVTALPGGQEALEWLSQNKADLVLTDIMMPCLDGFGLLKAIRGDAKLRTIPVILLSARAGEEASVEGLTSGADDYLVKPFSANELLARVRTHLEMTRIRQESQETLRQAQKMEVIGQLASGAAHDFNSLLTVIMGRLQLLKKSVATTDEIAQQSLETASHTTERVAKLIKQLLAFAQKQPLDIQAVSLNELVTNMNNLLQNALRDNIHLEQRLAEDLWPALADTTQIQLALLNLVLNARDAMPEGGRILISTQNIQIDEVPGNLKPEDLEPGEYVVLLATDTGTGMSKDVLTHAFEPFFTTKGVDAASGLGLSQVYGAVKQLGGTARIQSIPGQGTTVRLFLPRARIECFPIAWKS